MKTIDVTDKELTYLLLALKRYEDELLSRDDEDMEDITNDLLFVQHLRKKLTAIKQ